jgi:serine/threonine protein kinase
VHERVEMKSREAAEKLPSERVTEQGVWSPYPAPAAPWHAAAYDFPRAGVLLEGKYRLVYRLASGNMSSVWFAEHLVLAAPVAIKFMQPGAESDADLRRRFLREARIASAIRSPHVVQVLDYGVEHDTPYIVMEFLRGESLARRLRRVSRLSPAETLEILSPLAQALKRAHELGVVHRDLKPENVFIVTDGEREFTKLLDFGVAKVRERAFGVSVARHTAEGEIVGTPHYMSPEQARGERDVDHRTDVWALGVIAFECLLGFPPFIADGLAGLLMAICSRPLPVPSKLGAVPAGFDAWFARACNRAPESRFGSLHEAVRQLRGVCVGGASGASATSRAVPPVRIGARASSAGGSGAASGLPWRWLALVAVAALLGGAATGAARRPSEASRASAPRAAAGGGLQISGAARPDVTENSPHCCGRSLGRSSKE